jgi:hypothetical protein
MIFLKNVGNFPSRHTITSHKSQTFTTCLPSRLSCCYIWCCTSSVQQSNTHKFHYQLLAQCFMFIIQNSYLRSALFWNIMWHCVIIIYWLLGQCIRMIRYNMLWWNYNTMPHNIPEERRSHQHRGRSLKSRLNCLHVSAIYLGHLLGVTSLVDVYGV